MPCEHTMQVQCTHFKGSARRDAIKKARLPVLCQSWILKVSDPLVIPK